MPAVKPAVKPAAKLTERALAAVAGEPRRAILRLIWDRERSAGEIAAHFDITWPAVSQHLGVLREAGLIALRKDGNHRMYRADRRALRPLARVLKDMWEDQIDKLATLAEQAERTR